MSILDLFKKHQPKMVAIERSSELSLTKSTDYTESGVKTGGKKGSQQVVNKNGTIAQLKTSQEGSLSPNALLKGDDNIRELAVVHYAKALLGNDLVPNIVGVFDTDLDTFHVASEYLGVGSLFVGSLDDYARALGCNISESTRPHVHLVSGTADKSKGELSWDDLPVDLKNNMCEGIVTSAILGDHDFNPGNFIVFINPKLEETLFKLITDPNFNNLIDDNNEYANNIFKLYTGLNNLNLMKKDFNTFKEIFNKSGVNEKDDLKIELDRRKQELNEKQNELMTYITQFDYKKNIDKVMSDERMQAYSDKDNAKNLKLLQMGRIDFGHSLNHLVDCPSLFGGEVHNKENPILDFFNRERIGGKSLGGDPSKLWRDYPAVLPSQEMVNALRTIHANAQKNLNSGKENTKESFETLKNESYSAKGMNHILTSLKKICSGLNVATLNEANATKLNGSTEIPSELDSRCSELDRFILKNAGNLEKVANVMELQLNIDKYLNNKLTYQEITAKCDLNVLPCSGDNIHWVKTGEKNKAMVCNLDAYIVARAKELNLNHSLQHAKQPTQNLETSTKKLSKSFQHEAQLSTSKNPLVDELRERFQDNNNKKPSFFKAHVPSDNRKSNNNDIEISKHRLN